MCSICKPPRQADRLSELQGFQQRTLAGSLGAFQLVSPTKSLGSSESWPAWSEGLQMLRILCLWLSRGYTAEGLETSTDKSVPRMTNQKGECLVATVGTQ